MALLEAGPVFEDTWANLRIEEFDNLEPSIEELEAIEAEESVGELQADPLTLMMTYVKGLRGEPFAARDVDKFLPGLEAPARTQFMQRVIRRLQSDEETADRLRSEGNTKARKYWLASVLTPEAFSEGTEWFEANKNIELGPFEISTQAELSAIKRTLRELHGMREAGIQKINGLSIKDIFTACNASIKEYNERIAILVSVKERERMSLKKISVSSRNGEGGNVGDFTDYANCRGVDPELFFPERGASIKEAKSVCAGCVVREECGDYALANGERFGIWGGMSERERRRIRRAQKLAAQEEIS